MTELRGKVTRIEGGITKRQRLQEEKRRRKGTQDRM